MGELRLRRCVPGSQRHDALHESRWPERHVTLLVGFYRHTVRADGANVYVRLSQHRLEKLSREKREGAQLYGGAYLFLWGDNK